MVIMDSSSSSKHYCSLSKYLDDDENKDDDLVKEFLNLLESVGLSEVYYEALRDEEQLLGNKNNKNSNKNNSDNNMDHTNYSHYPKPQYNHLRMNFQRFYEDFRTVSNNHKRKSSTMTTMSTKDPPPACVSSIRNLAIVCNRVDAELETDDPYCRICFELFIEKEIIQRMPCGHCFHSECIVGWLLRRCDCPVCRFELPTDNPIYEEGRKERMMGRTTVNHVTGCNHDQYSETILEAQQQQQPQQSSSSSDPSCGRTTNDTVSVENQSFLEECLIGLTSFSVW